MSWTPAASGLVSVQRRPLTSTTWTPVTVSTVDGRHAVDLAALAIGDYEFRIAYADGSTFSTLGSISVRVNPDEQPATPTPSSQQHRGTDDRRLLCERRDAELGRCFGTPLFEARAIGEQAWKSFSVGTVNGRASVDISGCTPQSYEFRILYTSGSAIVARGAGNFTTHPVGADYTPAATLNNTAVANVGGYQVSPTALTWARLRAPSSSRAA